ncbi:RipA family octameric membrane protein [Haloferax sulfurifontis]|uniref:Uncharacterized protein n=1 Tax=Haloferax sulfurifontis ATCC BAA-897 TaxID=662480 RepID=M0I5B5_9EURY|nr:hypothetical protein [Haloferax sulfurifontis]ELZ91152.1 hypothetical protein C441_12495 [Haloferax sulfurifontis ATCC BAA-897]
MTNSTSDSGSRTQGKCGERGEGAQPDPTLEQWKHYEQTTRDVSNRRLKNNRFYQRLLGATVAGVGVASKFNAIGPLVYILVGVIGVAISLLWMLHIISYKQLNGGKYQILHELESELPNQPFSDEWTELKSGTDPQTYVTHTSVEIWWPRVTLWVFGAMSIYGCDQIQDAANFPWVSIILWTGVTIIYWIIAFRGYKPFNLIAPFWTQRKDSN